jgi:hypothetical protein
MRGPTSRVTINTVNIYANISGPDTDAGLAATYPAIPTFANVACTVQFTSVREITEVSEGGQARLTQENLYEIMFDDPPTASPRDKIVWVDKLGVTRNLYVEASMDEAGRGAAYTFKAVERQ